MKLEVFGQIFEKYSNTNLMKIRPVGAELFHADRRTDKHTDTINLIVDFRNFANASERILAKWQSRLLPLFHWTQSADQTFKISNNQRHG